MINYSLKPNLLRSYWQDKFIKINLFFCFLANLGLWFWVTWQLRFLPDLIPLHYNIYFGIDLLGSWYRILFLPAFGLIASLINFFLGLLTYRQEKIISYLLAGASSLIQLILIISVSFIFLINK